jgi:hypothetical protein
MALEEEFDVTVEEEELEGIETVGAGVDLVKASSDGGAGRASPSPVGVVAALRDRATPSGTGLCGPRGRHGRIEDFDPTPWFDNPKEARRTDRFAQFALAAAAEA